jgi:hypothetical protein
MITELQFVAIAAFLIWGLLSSLCDLLTRGQEEEDMVRRNR